MSKINMSEFYRKILNINPKKIEIEPIVEEAIDTYFKIYPKSIDGMCYVVTKNIQGILKSKNINSYQVNSLNLGSLYEHYFLIIDNIDLYLIDPTFSQFSSENKTLMNPKLTSFPSDILKKSNNKLYKDLITKMYSKVTIEDISLYIEALDGLKINNVDDLLLGSIKSSY